MNINHKHKQWIYIPLKAAKLSAASNKSVMSLIIFCISVELSVPAVACSNRTRANSHCHLNPDSDSAQTIVTSEAETACNPVVSVECDQNILSLIYQICYTECKQKVIHTFVEHYHYICDCIFAFFAYLCQMLVNALVACKN